MRSGLFKLVYSAEYGSSGGRPYAAVVCHERFDPEDLRLLRSCALVAELAALQFIGQAGERLLELALDRSSDEASWRWSSFRRGEGARFVSLVAGRWLARAPFRHDASAERPWPFHEAEGAPRLASGALLVALTLARSFERYRTPIHAFGATDGEVEGLPHDGGASTCGTARPEGAAQLAEAGFVPLVQRAPGCVEVAGDTTCIDASCGMARFLPETSRHLHARLPATLFAQRLVQYCKVLHREQVGNWLTPQQTRQALLDWLERQAVGASRGGHRPFDRYDLELREQPIRSHWGLRLELELDRWLDGTGCRIVMEGRLDLE
jgi:type VI secretion system protein ImpC